LGWKGIVGGELLASNCVERFVSKQELGISADAEIELIA
jgi:hypothetical protein